MKSIVDRRLFGAIFALVLTAVLSSSALGAATIVINNINGPGVGFNDPTPVLPVGGNTGTTLGQQRLNAFTHAANIWGATLTSSVPIVVNAHFTGLTCTPTGAVLGSAGAVNLIRDSPTFPFAGTWYSIALGNKLAGVDIIPANSDINANFNVNLGQSGCLTGTFFYLGLDGNHGSNIDLVATLLHELGHGLGFQTFTSGTTGAQSEGYPSVFDRFLLDRTSGKAWVSMSNAERTASAINTQNLSWAGPKVQADAPDVLSGNPRLEVNSPGPIAGFYAVGSASFGPPLSASGVTGNVVQALDPANGAGPLTTDGCSPLTNAAAVAGNIAVIDRGTCAFTVKTKNAQNAGAIAVIIVDNVVAAQPPALGGADATVVISAVSVTQAVGNTIKANLGSGVNATLEVDMSILSGADPLGKVLMYTPNPFQQGSSVSHWDTSPTPNLLMEPSINPGLSQSVIAPQDLTFALLSDTGWEASSLPTSIAVTSGNNQITFQNQAFAAPITATVSPAIPGVTVTWTAAPFGGSFGTFPSTNLRSANSVTNASGIATAPSLMANGVAGAFSLNATAPGSGTTTFSLTISLAPTSASVEISGRVLTPDGRGLTNAKVLITDSEGVTRTAITSSFGYYRFEGITAGETYIMNVSSRRYTFAARVVEVLEKLEGIDFIPDE